MLQSKTKRFANPWGIHRQNVARDWPPTWQQCVTIWGFLIDAIRDINGLRILKPRHEAVVTVPRLLGGGKMIQHSIHYENGPFNGQDAGIGRALSTYSRFASR